MTLLLRKFKVLIFVAGTAWAMSALAEISNLPERTSPRPITTDGIPHIQIDVNAVPELSAELLKRIAKISEIEQRGTIVGRAGSTGFWLHKETELTRPESTIRSREFAHLHPDGSLHASLPPALALKAVHTGWATYHPWAAQKSGLEGFVMIYTPASEEELDVVHQLVIESYRFVSETNETPK